MKKIFFLTLICISIPLISNSQEISKEKIYFNFDSEQLEEVTYADNKKEEKRIVVSSKKLKDYYGFHFLIIDKQYITNYSKEVIDFKQFLITNDLGTILNDDLLIKRTKFSLYSKNKDIFFVQKDKKGVWLYKVASVITEI